MANRAYYVINVTPRQLVPNGIGIDGFFGSGSFEAGESAAELDALIARLNTYTPGNATATNGPTIEVDIGGVVPRWQRATIADIQTLRAAFFSRYGLNKPNPYPPPLPNPGS